MGSPETEKGRWVEEGGPVHEVTLSPFLIAKYEVNQAEWKKVMGNNPSLFKGDALPVARVSWEDCQEFCKKWGLSLPTEAQWEYACRAGKAGPFAGTGKLDEMGWVIEKTSTGDTTHPVGEKLPNDFGLYDLHGNVGEVCEDWYQKDFYQESTGATDPLCENSASGWRVYRGGNGSKHARSACRGLIRPTTAADNLGFRPAWSSP